MQPALSLRWVTMLDQLAAALEAHLAAPDWDALAQLDQKIATALAELARVQPRDAAVLAAETRLHAVHQRARAACRDALESSRRQLLQHLQYAEARTAYSRTAAYGPLADE